MRNKWLHLMDADGGSSPSMFSGDPLVPLNFGFPLSSQLNSLVENSLYNRKNLYIPGGMALQKAFSCFSKFPGALLVLFTSGSDANINRNIPGNSKGFKIKSAARELQSLPMLALAVALIPPFGNSPAGALCFPTENTDNSTQRCINESPCGLEYGVCSDISFQNLNWTRYTVESRTGIEFPIILDNAVARENNSSLTSEVLVGTGSRVMTVVKVKSLKIYAFGFYVHPFDVCMKLGQKYASIPIAEVNKCDDFYRDLLREDINMSVRLVVNYSGMKISTVRDAFEKSLRARLLKTNPDTNYDCLKAFGSLFAQDIPLRVGTTIDFRRTTDGRLITEIEGNRIGAVQSKDLCRAFFDMYIGDVPVSEQTKEEIGKGVAGILRRC